MRNLVKLFVTTPFYANLIIIVILVGGIISYMSMKKSFFPEMTSRFIKVSVVYPGASPNEMEEGVTARIEESVRGLIGIKEVTSTSSENFAMVSIETTGNYDIDETLMEVKNAVDGISSFPVNAERPIVSKIRSESMAAYVSLSGDVDILALKEYYNQVETDFLTSGIISQIKPLGAPNPEISIEIKEDELLRYHLTFTDIARAVSANNRDIAAGQIKSKEAEMLIRLRSRSISTQKIGEIVIRGQADGSIISVRDVATVYKTVPEDFYGAFLNGEANITMMINKLPSEDLEKITDYLEEYTSKFNIANNNNIKLDISFNFYTMLKSRLELLYNNGFLGLLLVVFVLALFLSLRMSFWVAWGIPSAFLAMFIIAHLMGVTINMMSLFGMLLVIGILVDDGIVIGENIYTHFEQGKSPREAAVDGTMEVMRPVFTSILTTIIAFSPILFITGHMEMMKDMAIVVIIALAFSLIEAYFVLPAHLGNHGVLKHKKPEEQFIIRRLMNQFIDWLRLHIYEKFLVHLLKWRYVYVFVPVVLIFITIGLFGGKFIKTTFFPVVDFDQFNVDIVFVSGTGIDKTKNYLKDFEEKVWNLNEELMEKFDLDSNIIDYIITTPGFAFDGQEVGSHAGRLSVFPVNLENIPITGIEISQLLSEKIGKLPESEMFQIAGMNRFGKPFSVSLLSNNQEQLFKAKEYLKEKLRKYPELKDVVDNNPQGKQEIQLKLKAKAYFLGLDEQMIAGQIRNGFYGNQVQRLQVGRDEYRIWVRYPKEGRFTIGQFEKMKIKTRKGDYPVTELVTYEINRGPVSIKRYNSMKEARVEAGLVNPFASASDLIAKVEKQILPELEMQYPDVELITQGQAKESKRLGIQLGSYFAIAFMLMIIVLMIHFKSLQQPILILMIIPIGLLGVFWGHGLHDKAVSMLSSFGIVALTGVIINDAVVFLEAYNHFLRTGHTVHEAVIKAGKSRLRPIILTTLTTSVGLFPIILETSMQAQFLIPMAISLAYGVAIGTFFILTLLPVLIMILNDIRYNTKRLWTGNNDFSREDVEFAVIYQKREQDILL